MSRKDYVAAAQIIAEERQLARVEVATADVAHVARAINETADRVGHAIAARMADMFARENPRFDRGRFMTAAGS